MHGALTRFICIGNTTSSSKKNFCACLSKATAEQVRGFDPLDEDGIPSL